MPATYWNGEPTPARRVRLLVGKSEVPTWWCAELEGSIRDAVEVTYGRGTFYIDDEDGSGWAKVTDWKGSPGRSSRSLPDDSVVIEVRS